MFYNKEYYIIIKEVSVLLDKILKWFSVLLFAVIGILVFATYVTPLVQPYADAKYSYFYEGVFGITLLKLICMLTGGFLFGLIAFIFSPFLVSKLVKITEQVAAKLSKLPTEDILLVAFGGLVGLSLANLIGEPLSRIPLVGGFLPVIVSVVLGITGAKLALLKKRDMLGMFPSLLPKTGSMAEKFNKVLGAGQKGGRNSAYPYKILDTSVIIDGRIADICKTGFIEGTLVAPKFVLEELQKIADSSDALKRNRGRRGLDILNELQNDPKLRVEIVDKDYEELTEVDTKLIRLAQDMGGAVLTNDFNLNKVAELQGVKVLNINLLANMVKPLVLPGEEMFVHIAKEGKEAGQGIAYLDDGTMIVVEGARKFLGDDLPVVVTTALQTAAGRMIFAKVK